MWDFFFFPEDFSITECSDASVLNPYGDVKQSHFFEDVTSRAGNRIQVCVYVCVCVWSDVIGICSSCLQRPNLQYAS